MKNLILKKRISLIFVLIMVLQACKKDPQLDSSSNNTSGSSTQTDSVITKKDSTKVIVKKSLPPVELEMGFYNAWVFPKDRKQKDSIFGLFNKKYSEEERYAILALNRLDSKHKYNADTLVIPAKIDPTLMEYSPFPKQLDILSGVNKFVVFSYPIQAFAIYTNGTLEKWGPTSMGSKAKPTRTGLTFANWKKELAISTVKSEWKLPYNFNIFNHDGIGWHQYDLPGYPASHSCLRLLKEDAIYLYKYADTWILNPGGATTKARGTAVLVYGAYPWGKQKPWRKLLNDPTSNNVSIEEMTDMIQPNIEKILAEQTNRIKVSDSIKLAKETANSIATDTMK